MCPDFWSDNISDENVLPLIFVVLEELRGVFQDVLSITEAKQPAVDELGSASAGSRRVR